MKRIFILILFLIISNQAMSSIKDEIFICNNDTMGYNFISKDQVKISGINLNQLNTFSVIHSYELDKNAILIQEMLKSFDKEETPRLIGWIFRRTLDYVSLDYVSCDWRRKFLWNCEITTSEQLDIRIKDKLNKLIKVKKL